MRLLFIMAAVLLVLSPRLSPPSYAARQSDVIRIGEIQLGGTIVAVSGQRDTFTIKADTVVSTKGVVAILYPARHKQIKLTATTQWQGVTGANSGRRVRVIGKDLGTGRALLARLVGVEIAAKASPKVESLPAQTPLVSEKPMAAEVSAVASSTDLNAAILAFCYQNMGRKVGNGQCAVLAAEAVRAAGGTPMHKLTKDSGPNGDYVWGRLIYSREIRGSEIIETGVGAEVRPGDIIQYSNVRFEYRSSRYSYYQDSLHHTGIIARIGADGLTFATLDQNPEPVHFTQLYLPHMRQGTFKIYRAIPNTQTKER